MEIFLLSTCSIKLKIEPLIFEASLEEDLIRLSLKFFISQSTHQHSSNSFFKSLPLFVSFFLVHFLHIQTVLCWIYY